MMTMRLMSAVLLFNERDELLMMKRSNNRTLSPGKWGAVGGHIEPEEIGTPRTACLREIEEETGILEHEILNMELHYILMRLFDGELRQQFFYTATTKVNPRITTDEGELHWIPRSEILDRDLPFIFRMMLEHYLSDETSTHPWIGTAGLDSVNDNPTIHWTPFVDPLIR
ncbi:NUDIX hydrolase [Paenibacillus sp. N1-5-1-14]|uniref:NUDIX hydrolase n=1 Tax=Paenibacillus radicibacter TaxID=2972488 RepID=UPI002158E731|nr:NUDIX hydrolase [Paenibacillus radicibacter]MCR8644129.1 NUDIX hydrolase [Paenibacillus radicibacter]